MKTGGRWILGAALMAAWWGGAQAPAVAAAPGAGTASGTVVHLGSTARVLAMGGGGMADVAEPGAIWLNPAELARQQTPATSFLHGAWVQGVALEQLAVASPTPLGTVGGAVMMLRAGEIAGYDATGASTASISPADTLGSLAWATAVDRYTVGAAASYLSSQLADDAKASAFALDAGGSAQVLPELAVSAAVQHVGGRLTYAATGARLPAMIRAGGAWALPAYRMTVVLDAVKPQDGSAGLRAGAEERLIVRNDLSLAVRAGYHTDGPRGGAAGATAGAGFDWHPAGGFGGDVRTPVEEPKSYLVKAVRVEYAWTPLGELGAANWFSVALIF